MFLNGCVVFRILVGRTLSFAAHLLLNRFDRVSLLVFNELSVDSFDMGYRLLFRRNDYRAVGACRLYYRSGRRISHEVPRV